MPVLGRREVGGRRAGDVVWAPLRSVMAHPLRPPAGSAYCLPPQGVDATPWRELGFLARRCAVSRRFTEAEITEVWERRKAGEPTRSIARRLGRNGSSIRRLFEDAGGVRPARRCRSERHLSLAEREEISRGVAAGDSLREIASRMERAVSTISREVAGNGGRRGYRAHRADRAA